MEQQDINGGWGGRGEKGEREKFWSVTPYTKTTKLKKSTQSEPHALHFSKTILLGLKNNKCEN